MDESHSLFSHSFYFTNFEHCGVVWCGVVMLEHEGADHGGSCLVVPAVLRTLQSVQYSTVSYLLR